MPSTDTAFSLAEWSLLVRLPGQVVTAATAVGRGTGPATVAQALAGLDAIAAGRGSSSALVRRVVGTIYAERDAETGVPDGVDGVIAGCRRAAEILADRSPDDSAAYRRWVLTVADRTCGAAPDEGSDGALLLADIATALGG